MRSLYSMEAEAGVIGAMIINKEIIEDIGAILDRSHFYDEDYAEIYAQALRLAARGVRIERKRQRQIQAVCKLKLANGSSPFADYNADAWRAYFHMILENPWNTGENPSGWVATIDYATRPDTVIKTLEKKYA